MEACLAVEVDTFIPCETDFQCCNSVFWTDSTSVLQMIHNTSTRYPVFVANRLTKIEQGSNPTQWRYVDSKRNIADHVSRGLSATDTISASRWFKGPEFLYLEENWPQTPVHLPDLPEEFLTLHRGKQQVSSVQITCLLNLTERFSRFSSWRGLTRSIAWILRLKRIFVSKQVLRGPLTVEELQAAKVAVCKCFLLN